MEVALKHTFKMLKVNPNQANGVIITGRASDNDAKKEEIIQNLFESSEVNNCYLANSAAMALYSTGRTNGLVVKSGEASTRAVPVFEGHVIPHAV